MKVYIAAPWVRREEAKAIGAEFVAAGVEVTSRWFNHAGDPNDTTGSTLSIEQVRQQAYEDIRDVRRADYLVVLNLEKSEGKAVETGIALANEIPVISVGKRSNIFQSLAVELDTPQDALNYLMNLTQRILPSARR